MSSLYTRSSPIIDSDDEDDENEGEEWVFPVPDKKSKSTCIDMFASCAHNINTVYTVATFGGGFNLAD